MDTKELLKKVRKIEIKTRRLSNHVFGGEYHSTFKGRGMTFSEVRSYQFGDDVRSIDWNVTARYNEPFVKVFEEEREETIPSLGLVQMQDAETGEFMMVNTSAKSVRTAYAAYFKDREAYFKDSFNRSGAGTINTRVDEGYVKKLLGYFKRRG